MSKDKTNAERQRRFQERKKKHIATALAELDQLKANSINKSSESLIRAQERERCAKFCEGGENYQPAGRMLAQGIRMLS